MNPPLPHWQRCESEEEVTVPSPDDKSPATVLKVMVPAWRDPATGEIYLDGDAIRILDDARARHMGLLTSDDLKSIRSRLGRTQKQMCALLQIGEKTWNRWEFGRERPSKSLNVLLCALRDGKIDVPYLEWLANGQQPATAPMVFGMAGKTAPEPDWHFLLGEDWWRTMSSFEREASFDREKSLIAQSLANVERIEAGDQFAERRSERPTPPAENIIEFRAA